MLRLGFLMVVVRPADARRKRGSTHGTLPSCLRGALNGWARPQAPAKIDLPAARLWSPFLELQSSFRAP